jgi:gamma-butyrobetaine dioxygenase
VPVDAEYLAALSPASRYTLRLQGGPFGPDEVARFAASPYARDAVAVRRWDDAAKDPDEPVLPLGAFALAIRAVALRAARP